MEIKVNILNEMKKIRDTTYSDRYTWVDEIIQNCQRSHASHIDVKVDYDSIVVSDDGNGCDNPELLFHKSTSGWDADVTANESPFGEGFFSTMIAANVITVESIGFKATFDVEKMFETGNIDAVTVEPSRKKTGFTLTLTKLRSGIYDWDVIKRFKNTAKYIKSPRTKVNGELVKYEGLNPKEDDPFIRKVDTPYFKGWIQPTTMSRNHWDDPIIKCFAYNRLVKESKNFSGVKGVLNFKDNVIGLRSPDRREFIMDERYDEMMEYLKAEIKKAYIKLLRYGSDKDLKDFEYQVDNYISPEEYKRYLRFKFINHVEAPLYDEATTCDDEMQFDSIDDTSYYDGDTNDSPINDIQSAPVTTKDDFSKTSAIINVAAKSTRIKPETKQTGNELSDTMQYGFYLDSSEKTAHNDALALAGYHSIPVIEIRNRLERQVIEDDERFHHISEMGNMIHIVGEYTNIGPQTEQERRATKLLSRIADKFSDDPELFMISDTKFRKTIKIGKKECPIGDVDAFAVACDNKIYINRKRMNAYRDLTDDSSTLTPADIKFILMNLETFAHEMSHAIYGNVDETKQHFACINTLMQKIIHMIYGIENAPICI